MGGGVITEERGRGDSGGGWCDSGGGRVIAAEENAKAVEGEGVVIAGGGRGDSGREKGDSGWSVRRQSQLSLNQYRFSEYTTLCASNE